jgi:hypothetical protein
MSKKNYKVDEVIRSLSKKGCIITNYGETKEERLQYYLYGTKFQARKTIIHQCCICINNANNLGNKSWGKIDFLTNHKFFTLHGFGTYQKRVEFNK